MQACLADAEKGRMSQPALATSEICRYVLMSPRFGVPQGEAITSCVEPCQLLLLCPGTNAEGKPKVRPIDDLTASGVNLNTSPADKLHCDTLDMLLASLKEMVRATGIRVATAVATLARNSSALCSCRSCRSSRLTLMLPTEECQ